MLNIGLIGDIKLLETFTKKAQEIPEINITGKSSVGTQPLPGNLKLQAPEFNRIELIERSDALIINRFSLLPFALLCDMVKQSKHFFAASYPNLTQNEINQLAKLAQEAKTVIQIANPLYYMPAMQWLAKNLKKPAYVDVTYFNQDAAEKNTLLLLLLMLKDITGTIPKKSSAISFRSLPVNSVFNNVQLDFGDGSLININYGIIDKKPNQFKIKIYMHGWFTELDFVEEKYVVNNLPVDITEYKNAGEMESFLYSIGNTKKAATDIEAYSNVLQIVDLVQEKLDRYSSF